MHEEVTDDPSYLTDAMHRTLEKVRKGRDIDINTFNVEEPISGDFNCCL